MQSSVYQEIIHISQADPKFDIFYNVFDIHRFVNRLQFVMYDEP